MVQKQIKALGTDDKAERERIHKFLAHNPENFATVQAYFFPDVSGAISQLGNDDWKIRKKATLLLIKYGGPLEEQLKTLAKKHIYSAN